MHTFLEHAATLDPSQFPIAAKTRNGQRFLDKLCVGLNDAIAAGQVMNPVYQNLKYMASAIIEDAQDKPEWIYDQCFRAEARGTFTLWDLDNGLVYPNYVEGKLKKLASAKSQSDADRIFVKWLTAQLKDVLPLAQALLSLKDKAVKRTIKTDAEKAAEKQRYIAPMAKLESGQVVMAALTQMSNDLKDDYAEAVFDYFVKSAEKFDAMDEKEQKNVRQYYQQVVGIRSAWASDPVRFSFVYRLNPQTYKKAFKAAAKEAASSMQQQFVLKNSTKLVSILEKKGIALVGDPKVLHLQAGNGIFEGDIRIEFSDGSGFMVRNKIVLKQNNYGTVFNQFPTTFHDVKMADGSKMSSPSEERMNDVFATA